jgi:hypothetical protein
VAKVAGTLRVPSAVPYKAVTVLRTSLSLRLRQYRGRHTECACYFTHFRPRLNNSVQ